MVCPITQGDHKKLANYSHCQIAVNATCQPRQRNTQGHMSFNLRMLISDGLTDDWFRYNA